MLSELTEVSFTGFLPLYWFQVQMPFNINPWVSTMHHSIKHKDSQNGWSFQLKVSSVKISVFLS